MRALVFLCSLIVSTNALALEFQDKQYKNGEQLLSMCTGQDHWQVMCLGYIAGAADMYLIQNPECNPQNHPLNALQDQLVKLLKRKKDLRVSSAGYATAVLFRLAFSCGSLE